MLDPPVALACDVCGEAPALNCPIDVRVLFYNAEGQRVFCSTGTLLVDSTDPGARRSSPIAYAAGTSPSFPYYPFVPGEHTITVRQTAGTTSPIGGLLLGSAELNVLPNDASDQYWVSGERGQVAGDGTYNNPFNTITTALQKIPSAVGLPCIHVESGSPYTDRPVLRRPAVIVGDSITGSVLHGQGAGDAFTVALEAAGSTVRRLTLVGGVDTQDPIRGGLWIYGVHGLTVSNLVVRGNNNGIRVEDSSGIRIANCTIVRNAHDGVYGSIAESTLSSSIVRHNTPCDVLQGFTAYERLLLLQYGNFTQTTLCSGVDPGSAATSGEPKLINDLDWILDIFDGSNKAIGVVDGADPAVGLDVDRTLPDRGAYGGPWGEVHYALTLPASPRWPFPVVFLGLASAILVWRSGRKHRRKA